MSALCHHWAVVLGMFSLVREWLRVSRVLTWRWIVGMSSLVYE